MILRLEEPHLNTLRSIVKQEVDTSVWRPVIFGSRAGGHPHKFSDIDLGFIGKKPLPDNVHTRLWDALDESDLPYVVDIVDLSTAQSEFKHVAEQTMVDL